MIEGGAGLLQLLTELDAGKRDEAEMTGGDSDPEELARLLR